MKKQRTDECFRIDHVDRRSDGSLRVRGRLTKTGVYEYKRGEQTVRELRSEKEVFSETAMDSLNGAPITIDHPKHFVDRDNFKDLMVGYVTDVKADPPYVEGKLQVWDSKTVSMIENGHLKEISCGYVCVPKTLDSNEAADVEQTQIEFNHAALGPYGWGRLGRDVSLSLDSNDNEVIQPFEVSMDETQEPAQTVDAVEAVKVLLDEKLAPLMAFLEEKQTEDSPVVITEELPDDEAVDRMVQERTDATLSLELRARNAHEAIFAYTKREDGTYKRNDSYYVKPVLCGRMLCEEVLRTVYPTRTVDSNDNLETLVKEADLLATRQRMDMQSSRSTIDSLSNRLKRGIPASALDTHTSSLRQKLAR